MYSLKGYGSVDIVADFSHKDGGILQVNKSQLVLVLLLHGDATSLCSSRGAEKCEAGGRQQQPSGL